MAVGNIVRRVLGIVREISEDDQNPGGLETLTRNIPTDDLEGPIGGGGASRLPSTEVSAHSDDFSSIDMSSQKGSYGNQPPQSGSLFGLFQHPNGPSGFSPPPSALQSPSLKSTKSTKAAKEKIDIKAEVLEGVKDLLDELDSADTQISEFALDHIHSNETILTHTSSHTVQKFLLAAAKKRKFTVFHAEAYPNDHQDVHDAIVNGAKGDAADAADEDDPEERWKTLTSMGIQVVLIPDSAVFALMSRIDKVLLAPHSVLADGSLLAASGASVIAQAAKVHHKPVVVLSGVYKLSPVYPFDTDELIEYGDPGKVVPYSEGEFLDKVDVVNPVYDWVHAELVDLYVTNLGGYAPSYLYQVIDDHYYTEDTDLGLRA